MKSRIFIAFLLFFSFYQLKGQQLSNKATISVITCGPGNVLYSSFGHSAFRVYDPIQQLDRVYNYGTFNFKAPNFYLNFVKGNLTYQLSTLSFNRFLGEYNYEKRWVKAQELNLTSEENQLVFDFLRNNAKPQNKDYQYDFFYDNCATRIESVIKKVLKDKVEFSNSHIQESKTHRDLINDYAHNFTWGKFGIDLILGSVIDDKATKDEFKFLPDYIFKGFNNATIERNDHKVALVKRSYSLIKPSPENDLFSINFISPIFIISFLSFIGLLITYKDFKTKKRTKSLDFLIYFITGILGITILLLWFATTHTATYKNLNLLWAFTPNLVIAFYLLKNNIPSWIVKYNYLLLSLLGAMLFIWTLKIQVFNYALLPLILLLSVRYVIIMKLSSYKK